MTVVGSGLTGVEAAAAGSPSSPSLTVTFSAPASPARDDGDGRAPTWCARWIQFGITQRSDVRVSKVLPDGVELDSGGTWSPTSPCGRRASGSRG